MMGLIVAIVTLINLVVGWFTGKNRLIIRLAELEGQDEKLRKEMELAMSRRGYLRASRLQAQRTDLAHRIARTRRALRYMGVSGL